MLILERLDWLGIMRAEEVGRGNQESLCLTNDKLSVRYRAASRKNHWCHVYEIKEYPKWMDSHNKNFKLKRDLHVLRHYELEMLAGPSD